MKKKSQKTIYKSKKTEGCCFLWVFLLISQKDYFSQMNLHVMVFCPQNQENAVLPTIILRLYNFFSKLLSWHLFHKVRIIGIKGHGHF